VSPHGLALGHHKRKEGTVMQAILTALLVVAVLGVSVHVAFAGDEAGSDQDHAIVVSQEVIEEPTQLGTLSGPEQAPGLPYYEWRHGNHENN
jgi:amino acid transporter